MATGAGNVSSRTTRTFLLQILTGPWLMVFGALLIMSVSGSTYIFGLYSGDIKHALGYDQTTLNLLSFFKDLGINVSVVAGLIAEVTPPWFILCVGAVMNFFGYFMMWMAVTKRISKPTVWQMCLYIFIGNNSDAFINTATLVTSVKNFPMSRGVVLGLLKSYVGLSGAIMTQLYHAIYGDDSKQLILLIGLLPAIIPIVFAWTIRVRQVTETRDQPNELNVFYKILYISLGLAAFLMMTIILEKKFDFNRSQYISTSTVVLILLFLPIVIVIAEEFKIWMNKQAVLDDPVLHIKVITDENYTPTSTTPMPTETVEAEIPSNNDEANISCWKTAFKPPKRGDDYTILQALFSIDMLILFLTTSCGIGGALTAINNLEQIGASQGYPKQSISTFISLVSIWNYFGRVTSGFVSEYFLTKYKVPRPLMLTLIMLVSCIGHLLIAFNVSGGLYAASVIIGFCFGAQWPMPFTIISEIFGLKYYSTLYNFGVIASPIGLYILNVQVAGHLYDAEGRKQMAALGISRKAGEDLNCTGTECFKLSFIIIAAATLFGVFISVILVLRTRKFYKSDIYKKFRNVKEAETEMAVPGKGAVAPVENSCG